VAVQEGPLGSSAVLRVSGLPIRYWLDGANPSLFSNIACLDVYETAHRAEASHLAEWIGERIVPHRDLAPKDRAVVLALRRSLHRGDPIGEPQYAAALGIVARLPGMDAAGHADLIAFQARNVEFAGLKSKFSTELAAEEERLLGLPDKILAESSVARTLPGLGDWRPDSRSVPLSGRQSRRRFELAWRRITRATTVSTPRDWLSHIGLIEVYGTTHRTAPRVGASFFAQWTENVRSRRRALSNPPSGWPHPDSLLAVNPLHWDDGDRLHTVVLDQHDEPTQVSVRHTPLLDAIREQLSAGALTFDDVVRAIRPRIPDTRADLQGFVRHLVIVGILQPGEAPHARMESIDTTRPPLVEPNPTEPRADGWVDVYRTSAGGLSVPDAKRLQSGLLSVMRLLSFVNDNVGPTTSAREVSTGAWLFTDLLRDELAGAKSRPQIDQVGHRWTSDTPAGGRYAGLLQGLLERSGDAPVLDIGSDVLDRLGAPDHPLRWPADFLLRVPSEAADFDAALDQIWPPGMLDARFAQTLSEVYASVPHVDAYRAFLNRLEELTGILIVEVLTPPLADGAANAVRRPVYTRAWTGDPHPAAYFGDATDPGRYIPLQAIRIRRIAGRLRAEVDGRSIWPVYHATRSFSPPWDRLARILLATAPDVLPWTYQRLDDTLRLLPERNAVPRIMVGGSVVLSPAQWRIARADLWDKDAPTTTKLRVLGRLRDRLLLPRWLHLVPPDDEPRMACDLGSLHAIRAFERYADRWDPIIAIEMLPSPDRLWVADEAHRAGDLLGSELQFRLPVDETPSEMAARLAPDIVASFSCRETHRARRSCRGPPSEVGNV
jgi:hypothetical protein